MYCFFTITMGRMEEARKISYNKNNDQQLPITYR